MNLLEDLDLIEISLKLDKNTVRDFSVRFKITILQFKLLKVIRLKIIIS
jgi:hypothetical protein